MRIALVTDAWAPQVNGVVRTLTTTVGKLRARGHTVETITPADYRTLPCPSYPEIRLSLAGAGAVGRRIERFGADAVHIATEGPLGWAARRWCLATAMPFTTSFHTRFPDYVAMRTGLSPKWFWPIVRQFHAPAARILVATPTLADELAGQGLPQTHLWSRGVDLAQFGPAVAPLPEMAALAGPIQLYVGRVAVEKNIAAFLACTTPGTKVVVGDGPARADLQRAHPGVCFLGALHGARLASAYAAADLFVFPSRTDTFGLVIIEALASGLPVAAFPVPGPVDIIGADGCGVRGGVSPIGALDADLNQAIARAAACRRAACATEGARYSWDACLDQFLSGLSPVTSALPIAA